MRPSPLLARFVALSLGIGLGLALAHEAHADVPSEAVLVPRSFWERGKTRAFFSSDIVAGLIYIRPHLALGYGRPHFAWLGVEAIPLLTQNGIGQYGGIRAVLPYLDMRLGARYFLGFDRSYMPAKESINTFDFHSRSLPVSEYVALEADVSAQFPLGPGSLTGDVTVHKIQGVPADVFVYEEALRTVVKAPYLARWRIGYRASIGRVRVGPAGETLWNPGRDAVTVRAGLIAAVVVNPHFDIVASFLPVISGPDQIGLAGAEFSQLGIRYRFATGTDEF